MAGTGALVCWEQWEALSPTTQWITNVLLSQQEKQDESKSLFCCCGLSALGGDSMTLGP